MKFFLLALTLLTSTAFADICYEFDSNKGPTRMGQIELAAPADKMCFDYVSTSGTVEMKFFTEEEEVARFKEKADIGNCNDFCFSIPMKDQSTVTVMLLADDMNVIDFQPQFGSQMRYGLKAIPQNK